MNKITVILTILVALEHLYIMYLETIATDSKATSRTFSLSSETLKDRHISTLLRNQGVYNGLLALLLAVALWHGDVFWMRLLLGYVVAVALYGGITSNANIILKQGGLAVAALLCSLL